MADAEAEDYRQGKAELRYLLGVVVPDAKPFDTITGMVSQLNEYIGSLRANRAAKEAAHQLDKSRTIEQQSAEIVRLKRVLAGIAAVAEEAGK